jgi:hypothetical protein
MEIIGRALKMAKYYDPAATTLAAKFVPRSKNTFQDIQKNIQAGYAAQVSNVLMVVYFIKKFLSCF